MLLINTTDFLGPIWGGEGYCVRIWNDVPDTSTDVPYLTRLALDRKERFTLYKINIAKGTTDPRVEFKHKS